MTNQPDPFGTPGKGDPFGTPTQRGHDYDDAEARAAVPRDQWDRYLIPGPDGIKPAVNKGRTRVSTTKSVGADQTRLQAYSERMILKGLALDAGLNAEALRAQALPEDSREQKRAFARVSALAYERAGGNERRDRGTELHELLDNLTKDPATEIPDHLAPEVTAYRQALADHHLTPLPEYNESVVVCPYDHGGAIDSIMLRWNTDTEMYEYVIVDYKTGRTLDWSKMEFLSQLWFYANSYYRFITEAIERDDTGKVTAVRGHMENLPAELRTDKVILMHAPLDGSVSVYELDISGWGRVVAAQVELRRANAEAQHRYRLLGTVRPDAFVAQPAPVVETRQGVVVVPADQGPVYNEQFVPTPTAPTPEAAANEAKAAERQQIAAKVLAPTSGQEVTEPPAPTHDPVTGRKKRTCGFCHLPGHTQKNCPKNPASAKYEKPVLSVVPEPAGDPAPGAGCNCLNDGDWHPVGTGGCVLNNYPIDVTINGEQATVTRVDAMAKADGRNDDPDEDQDSVPYCLKRHPRPCQWTSQPPAATGTWGCSITGKPSKLAYDTGVGLRVTAVAPTYGHPDGDRVAHLNPKPETALENPWAPQPAPDMVLWAINNAQRSDDVLRSRAEAMGNGTWVEAVHDGPARAKYEQLQAAERAAY